VDTSHIPNEIVVESLHHRSELCDSGLPDPDMCLIPEVGLQAELHSTRGLILLDFDTSSLHSTISPTALHVLGSSLHSTICLQLQPAMQQSRLQQEYCA
jgi:hypothetical protein